MLKLGRSLGAVPRSLGRVASTSSSFGSDGLPLRPSPKTSVRDRRRRLIRRGTPFDSRSSVRPVDQRRAASLSLDTSSADTEPAHRGRVRNAHAVDDLDLGTGRNGQETKGYVPHTQLQALQTGRWLKLPTHRVTKSTMHTLRSSRRQTSPGWASPLEPRSTTSLLDVRLAWQALLYQRPA
jgi:hypothetical protein